MQTAALGFGIWVMRRASNQRDVQIGQQSEQLRQQAIDSERRHEHAMTALQALIERMGPRPPEPSTG